MGSDYRSRSHEECSPEVDLRESRHLEHNTAVSGILIERAVTSTVATRYTIELKSAERRRGDQTITRNTRGDITKEA